MGTQATSRIRLLIVVMALALTIAALLACGPADQYNERFDNATVTELPNKTQAQADSEDESDTTDVPPTVLPTKPPFPPTNTPFPTLSPDPTPDPKAVAEHNKREAARQAAVLSAADQTTKFAREKLGRQYDVIVKATVQSHRLVQPNTDITWPDDSFSPPYFLDENGDYMPWRRSRLSITTTYQGSLPQGYEIVSMSIAPNRALDVGQEYILFIQAGYVAEDEYTDRPSKHHYNAEQLEAFGGRAGHARLEHAWAIDGDTAWRLPGDHFLSRTSSSGLAAAKAAGESLSVTDLVAAINKGLGN